MTRVWRNTIRAVLVGAAVVLTAPLWAWARLALTIGLGDGPFAACSQFLGFHNTWTSFGEQASAADVPLAQQGGSFSKVHIGRNCWIGNSTVIMADVGEGSVIGAGSVVVKAIPARCVAVGNPAVVIKKLDVPSDAHHLNNGISVRVNSAQVTHNDS